MKNNAERLHNLRRENKMLTEGLVQRTKQHEALLDQGKEGV